ncbi:MAG: glycosyltransferase family 2 protein [Chloroflexi bacterium]|nr:glycosyltransferase family 2 protein [Chloroflexota bacterium]
MPSIDLAIIIVNWNVADLLRACLDSIYHAPGAQLEADGTLRLGNYRCTVFVVDNASTDNSPQMVRELFPQVQLIASQRNLGFTGGNNIALRRCNNARYVLLLNPDTRVVGNALTTMLDYIESHEAVGVIGPQLRYGDGSLQSSRRRFPTLMTAFMESTLLQQWFPRNRWARRYYMADTPDDATQQVDWVNGACMLVRSAAIQRVGLLDEGFFMYSEELDWCRRMVADGWQVVYLPQAVVIHYEGQSSGQVVAARHIRFERSKIRYFRKHHGAWQAALLRLFLLSTYVYRLLEEGAKYLLGHKRELRRARLAAYAQVIRSGLRPAHV